MAAGRNFGKVSLALRTIAASILCDVVAFTPKHSSHCLIWSSEGTPSSIRAEGTHSKAPEPLLCRLNADSSVCPFAAGACGAKIGERSTHLNLGTLVKIQDADGSQECVPIALGGVSSSSSSASAQDFKVEYATIDPTCDVWWREVSADVIPPIPELMLSFGTSPSGDKMGLCRTFGDDTSIDGGHKIVGTLVQEGPDYGRCFFTRADGSTGMLDGGMFHVLQARAAEASCVDDAVQQSKLSSGLRQRLDNFFSAEDKQLVEKVVGSALKSFAELQDEVLSLGSCDLQQVLSAARFLPHRLNIKGLHVLRALLAERMVDARAKARGFDKDVDYMEWKRNGVLFRDFDKVGDAGLHRLMQLAQGETTVSIPLPPYEWVGRNVSCTGAWDPQNDMHMDTFASIVKIWIFEQDVTLNEGPLNVVPGSHLNSEARLRWMHAYGLPPAKEALMEPSFRLLGSESAMAAAPDFIRDTLKGTIAALPLPGAKRTLVIADTSGLHARGVGAPGHTRNSWRLRGDTDGGLKRLNPYRLPEGFDIAE